MRYTQRKNGYHGGLTLQEAVVPIGIFTPPGENLKALKPAESPYPPWWRSAASESEPPAQPPPPPRNWTSSIPMTARADPASRRLHTKRHRRRQVPYWPDAPAPRYDGVGWYGR